MQPVAWHYSGVFGRRPNRVYSISEFCVRVDALGRCNRIGLALHVQLKAIVWSE